MASRGQTTDEDLKTALQGIGALDHLRPQLRRENVFGAPAPRPLRPAEEVAAKEPERPIAPATVPAKPQPRPQPAPRPRESPRKVVAPTPEEPKASGGPLFTDGVTVKMSAEMRNRATVLAAELQRRRTERTDRITPNTVFRVAIQLFLDAFALEEADPINCEEDLLEQGRALLAKSKKATPRTEAPPATEPQSAPTGRSSSGIS